MPTFNLPAFRAAYPQFAAVSDATVNATATAALCFVGQDGACDCDETMWQLMVAHMLQLQAAATNGGASGPVTSASIDKVSVTIAAPPVGSSVYKFWLFSTPYGTQLAALLSRCSSGGVYVGGQPERAAFRSVAGVFPEGRWLR